MHLPPCGGLAGRQSEKDSDEGDGALQTRAERKPAPPARKSKFNGRNDLLEHFAGLHSSYKARMNLEGGPRKFS